MVDKFVSKVADNKKVSDERGIRTPEAHSTTGLAILRHTGLGYLVIIRVRA